MINLNKFIPYWLFLFSLNAYVTAENINVPVYGALGDSVYLHFNTTLNSSVHVKWKHGGKPIGAFKDNKMVFTNPYINRTEIFANGTLRLDRTQKNDSGDYSVDVFNTDGTNIFKGSMQVYIQVTAENISVPVYGALGHSVYLHFNTTLNSSVHVEWKQGDNRIGVFKNNRTVFNNPYINRTEIFANGTLRLDRTQKNDSGDYSVAVFTTDGTNIFKGSMQVYIQEAVSQPVVHSTCLSHGKVLLVCTVDKGDNASFNWSLDGVLLNTSLAYFSDEEYVVILKKHVSGNLVCIATNQVSTNQSDSVIPNCSEAVSQPVVHSTCLSQGEVLLVCTVDKGDNASFNWSLDGVPLNPSLAYFSDEEHIVILKKNVTGDLVCIAKNQINEHKSDSVKSNCSGSRHPWRETATSPPPTPRRTDGEDKAIQVRLVYGFLAFVILTIFPITLHCNSWKSNSKGKQRTYLEMKMRKKKNEHFSEEQI